MINFGEGLERAESWHAAHGALIHLSKVATAMAVGVDFGI